MQLSMCSAWLAANTAGFRLLAAAVNASSSDKCQSIISISVLTQERRLRKIRQRARITDVWCPSYTPRLVLFRLPNQMTTQFLSSSTSSFVSKRNLRYLCDILHPEVVGQYSSIKSDRVFMLVILTCHQMQPQQKSTTCT